MPHVFDRVTKVPARITHGVPAAALASCFWLLGFSACVTQGAPPSPRTFVLPEGEAPVGPEEEPAKGPEMIELRGGVFVLGAASGPADERPTQEVYLSAFWLDRTEVSASAYQACVEVGACSPAGTSRMCTSAVEGKANHPINCITWVQAEAYCKFAKKRLPTEAEWERAARGQEGRRFVWGDQWPPPAASGNLADQAAKSAIPYWNAIDGYTDGYPATAPVDAPLGPGATPEGILHLAGNVAEWVADWYDPRAHGAAKASDPMGPKRGLARVIRGGSFGASQELELTTSRRHAYRPSEASVHFGVRCARSSEERPE